jgi:flagellar biosynthesis GTPase FlhF
MVAAEKKATKKKATKKKSTKKKPTKQKATKQKTTNKKATRKKSTKKKATKKKATKKKATRKKATKKKATKKATEKAAAEAAMEDESAVQAPAGGKKADRGKRYSDAEKQQLLSRYRELRNAGQTAKQAAASLGMPYLTLRRWELAVPATAPAEDVRRAQVRVPPYGPTVEVTSQGHLTLVTPAGFRIEGLSTPELIRVIESL